MFRIFTYIMLKIILWATMEHLRNMEYLLKFYENCIYVHVFEMQRADERARETEIQRERTFPPMVHSPYVLQQPGLG